MQVQLYQVDHGGCPYLPDRRWVTHGFRIDQMPPEIYERMLRDGWRRSGTTFYQNHCPGCACCTPVRVPVAEFQPSRSQRRAMRRNGDVEVTVSPNVAAREPFDLYQRYVRHRHKPDETITMEQFQRFLVDSPVETLAMRYSVNGRLIGVGWVDLLADGLSSVYFAFDPDEGARSLGVYSIVREIEHAGRLGKRWLYLGFYVPGSPKMAYKGAFRPNQFALNGAWNPNEEEIVCSPR